MSTPADSPAPLRTYFALIRPANVVTALADILAGAAVAGAGASAALVWLLPSTMCLYAGGIVLNDYFDRAIDAIERPERAIPRGLVPAATARTLGLALLGAGIGFATGAGRLSGLTAAAVAVCVLLYDAWGKHHPFLGPVNMGACRGLNLMLGMTAVPAAVAPGAALALLPFSYIAGVTVLSRGEVAGGKRPVALLALAMVVGVVGTTAWLAGGAAGGRQIWALVIVALFGYRVLPPFFQAWQDPAAGTIRRAVRTGVLSLVLLDATLAAAYAGMMMSLLVLATALLASWLARRFAVT